METFPVTTNIVPLIFFHFQKFDLNYKELFFNIKKSTRIQTKNKSSKNNRKRMRGAGENNIKNCVYFLYGKQNCFMGFFFCSEKTLLRYTY